MTHTINTHVHHSHRSRPTSTPKADIKAKIIKDIYDARWWSSISLERLMLPPVHSREGGRRGRRSRYARRRRFLSFFIPSGTGRRLPHTASFAPPINFGTIILASPCSYGRASWCCFWELILILLVRALRKLAHTSSGTRQHAAFVREEKEMTPPGNLTVDNHAHELGNHLLSHKLTLLIVSFVSFSQVNTKN